MTVEDVRKTPGFRTRNVRIGGYGGAMTNCADLARELPLAGTGAGHLAGALGRLCTTFRWKAGDLDGAGLRTRVGASALALGALLRYFRSPNGSLTMS